MTETSPFDAGLEKGPANFQPLTPLGFLERAAAVYPERTAVVYGARHTNYLERAYPSDPGLTTCWVCGCHRRNVRLMFCHAQPLEVRPPDVPRRLRGALSR